jgi:hypothetical protein
VLLPPALEYALEMLLERGPIPRRDGGFVLLDARSVIPAPIALISQRTFAALRADGYARALQPRAGAPVFADVTAKGRMHAIRRDG